jgi:hypothetical protein
VARTSETPIAARGSEEHRRARQQKATRRSHSRRSVVNVSRLAPYRAFRRQGGCRGAEFRRSRPQLTIAAFLLIVPLSGIPVRTRRVRASVALAPRSTSISALSTSILRRSIVKPWCASRGRGTDRRRSRRCPALDEVVFPPRRPSSRRGRDRETVCSPTEWRRVDNVWGRQTFGAADGSSAGTAFFHAASSFCGTPQCLACGCAS